MELIFNREDLWKAVQMVSNVAASRNTLPILSNVLIKTIDDKIQLSATDLEIGIKSLVNGEIITSGSITIPAKKLSEIVHELPSTSESGEPTRVKIATTSNDRVEIECERAKFRVVGLTDEEFPSLPDPSETFLTLNSNVLRQMIQKTIFAASTEETRHFLNGVYLVADNSSLKMVATDGRRLAVVTEKLDEPINQKLGIIIPTKTVNNIIRIFTEEEDIKIAVLENQVIFANQDIALISRLIEGEYPDYEAVINPVLKNEIVMKAKTEQLLSVIRRVSLLANPKTPSIKLEAYDEELTVTASTPELGEAREQMQASVDSGKIEIAFNARFIMDVLRNIETQEAILKFRDSLSPVLVTPSTDAEANYLCIIMPMRL